MKVLIWIANFIAITILNVFLGCASGYKLGYGLTYLACFILPIYWFKLYDEHLLRKYMDKIKPEATAMGMSPAQYLLKDTSDGVIGACEHYRSINKPREVKSFLKTLKGDKQISKYVYLYLLYTYGSEVAPDPRE